MSNPEPSNTPSCTSGLSEPCNTSSSDSSSSENCTATDAAHPRFIDNEKSVRVEPMEFNGRVLRVAVVQMKVGMDKCKNIEEAVNTIRYARTQGAHIVCLPECFNSPYGTKYFKDYAECIPNGQTSCAMSCAASQSNVTVVAGSIPEMYNDHLYNTCTVWNNCGQLVALHRKMHLFDIDIPGGITFKESDVLAPGNRLAYFDYCGTRIGLGICYDLRFYEMAHLLGALGCQILIYPAAFNMTTGPLHWELVGRSRANDQQAWVILASPARDEKADYVAWGHSMVINPWAEVACKLDENPGVLIADLDLSVVSKVRSNIPIRKQRRIDLYDTVKKCDSLDKPACKDLGS